MNDTYTLIVRLPADRDYTGTLELRDARSRRLAGPFEVCGRADDTLARKHRNPTRNPLLPHGDMPLGEYRVKAGTAVDELELEPRNGDAALADANGRFRFLIQGGGLRPMDDGLRLADSDLRDLLRALGRLQGGICTCVLLKADARRNKVALAMPAPAPARREAPPPAPAPESVPIMMSRTPRRSRLLMVFWLRALMGATGALVAMRSAVGAIAAAPPPDPSGDLRSVLSARGSSTSPVKPRFAPGRLFARMGGDYTQPEEETPAQQPAPEPAPQESSPAPAPTEPEQEAPAQQDETPAAPDTSAIDQLNNAATSSQNAAAASTPEEAKEEAGRPFDQGSQPAAPAPAAPEATPAPVQEAPQENTPAEPDEDTTPTDNDDQAPTSQEEDQAPAQQDEENEEEDTPAQQEEQAPQEQSPSAPAYSAPTPTYSAPAPAPAYHAPAYQQPAAPAPAVPQRGNLYVDPASFQKYLQPAPVQQAPKYDPAKIDAEIKGIKQALDRLKTVSAANLARSAEWMKASNDATKDAWESGKNLTVDLLVAGLKSNAGTLDKEMQGQLDKIINTTDPAEKKALQDAFLANAEHKEQLQKAFEGLEYAHKGTDVLTMVDNNYNPGPQEEKTRAEKIDKILENTSDALQLVAPGQTGLIKSYVDAGYDIMVQCKAVAQVNSANEGQTQYLQAVTALTKRMQVLVDLKKKNGLPPAPAGD